MSFPGTTEAYRIPLHRKIIRVGGSPVDAASFPDCSGTQEKLLGKGCLSGINMREEANVSVGHPFSPFLSYPSRVLREGFRFHSPRFPVSFDGRDSWKD